MINDITVLFCFVDDFCKMCEVEIRRFLNLGHMRKPTRVTKIIYSEIITILLMFQTSGIRNFKWFYYDFAQRYRAEFPNLPSYDRFIALQPRVLDIMTLLFYFIRAKSDGIAFIDSTKIKICHNKRIFSHKVFNGLAKVGKSTMGWFFGFKLHLIINPNGEIMNAELTSGNCDDRKSVENLLFDFKGKLFADKGYLSKELFNRLYEKGVQLVTGIKKSMKNILMPFWGKVMLKKRSLIESVFNCLKNQRMIEHTRLIYPPKFRPVKTKTLIRICNPGISEIFHLCIAIIHIIRRIVIQILMQTPTIIKIDKLKNFAFRFSNCLKMFQKHAFLLYCSPHSFDINIIRPATFAVHARINSLFF